MRVYVVRKWPLWGRSRFVCWNITRVNLWLLCNVHFVQSIRPTIATWPRWPKGTDHCSSEEYRCTYVDTCMARTWISYQCVPCHPWCTRWTSLVVPPPKKKLFQFSCGCEKFHSSRSFGFLVIEVCNHGEHYETCCTIKIIYVKINLFMYVEFLPYIFAHKLHVSENLRAPRDGRRLMSQHVGVLINTRKHCASSQR